MLLLCSLCLACFVTLGETGCSKRYHFYAARVNYFRAAFLCRTQGMRLAMPMNGKDSVRLGKWLRHYHHQNGGRGVWVGMDRLGTKNVWVNNYGFPITGRNFHWAKKEPNNAGGNERCLELLPRYNGVWNDLRCSYHLPFVCWG